jgi:hypothetical protein
MVSGEIVSGEFGSASEAPRHFYVTRRELTLRLAPT